MSIYLPMTSSPDALKNKVLSAFVCFLILTLSIISTGAQGISFAAEIDELGEPPIAPARPKGLAPNVASQVTFTNFLRIDQRETARQFYNCVFLASEGVPMDWSGSYAGAGTAGTNSTAYLDAVARRVNYYRAMAGVPAWITLDQEYTRKAQAAALMMGGNDQINHYPPTSWNYYTADGAEAAQNSNLSLGNAGPQAVMSQIRDNGANNTIAGHRRWILYPQTQVMGSGNVPSVDSHMPAGVLWIFDTHTWDGRPATRENFVAWPPPGYVPYNVVYARWSFAYPNANLGSATVTMTSNGVPLSVSLEAVASGFYGEITLVWVPAGLDRNNLVNLPKPATNTVYHVSVGNVLINGSPQTFNYDVIVFDPAVPGPDYFPPTITGTNAPTVAATNLYSFTAVSNAGAYEWRQSSLASAPFFDGAETGLGNFLVNASTNLYAVRDSAVKYAGSYSFHFAHGETVNQTLTLNRLFLATSNSTVQFQSQLGWATANQVARVQVSLNDGVSWVNVYSQPGDDGSGETSFSLRSASLAPFAGRTFRLRLNYEFNFGSYFNQTDSDVGWHIDNLTVTNAPAILSSTLAAANTNRTFGLAPTNAGSYLLEVRPLLFGDYPSDWGPSLLVNAVANTNVIINITGIAKSSGNSWNIDFDLLNGSPTGFELWSATDVAGTFTRETTANIQTLVPGSKYRAVVTTTATKKFFRIKPL